MPRQMHPRRYNPVQEPYNVQASMSRAARERFTQANVRAERNYLVQVERARQRWADAQSVHDEPDTYEAIATGVADVAQALQRWVEQFQNTTGQFTQTLRNWSEWWRSPESLEEGTPMPITTTAPPDVLNEGLGEGMIEAVPNFSWGDIRVEPEPTTEARAVPRCADIPADIQRLLMVTGVSGASSWPLTMYDIDASPPGSPEWIGTMTHAIHDAINTLCGAIFLNSPYPVAPPEQRTAWVRPEHGHATESDAPPWTWSHNPLCPGLATSVALSWWYVGPDGPKPEPFLQFARLETGYGDDGRRLTNPITGLNVSVPYIEVNTNILTVRRRVFFDETTRVPYLAHRSENIVRVLSDNPAVSSMILDDMRELLHNVNQTIQNCFMEHFQETSRLHGEQRSEPVFDAEVYPERSPYGRLRVTQATDPVWDEPQPLSPPPAFPTQEPYTLTINPATVSMLQERLARRRPPGRTNLRALYTHPETNEPQTEAEPVPEPELPSSIDTGIVERLQTELLRLQGERITQLVAEGVTEPTIEAVAASEAPVDPVSTTRQLFSTRRYG